MYIHRLGLVFENKPLFATDNSFREVIDITDKNELLNHILDMWKASKWLNSYEHAVSLVTTDIIICDENAKRIVYAKESHKRLEAKEEVKKPINKRINPNQLTLEF